MLADTVFSISRAFTILGTFAFLYGVASLDYSSFMVGLSFIYLGFCIYANLLEYERISHHSSL